MVGNTMRRKSGGWLKVAFLFLGGESTFERSGFSPCRVLFFSKLIVLGLLSIHGEMRGRKISRGHGKFLFQLKLHSSANSSTNRLLIG